MIISKTPYRISFFGGGTDFPDWYRENGGSVLSTTINKYCYISCRVLPPFFEHKHRLVYSRVEDVKEGQTIRHPSIRAVFDWLKISEGLEIHHDGDLPARSGLGSSSSFTAGLLNVLKAHCAERYSKRELAEKTIFVEQKLIGENVGSQDQIAVSYGGFNHIEFMQSTEQFSVNPMIVSPDTLTEIEKRLLLIYTGHQRFSNDIEKEKLKGLESNKRSYHTLSRFVTDALNILNSKNFDAQLFGKLMHESWEVKKSLSSSVSNDFLNSIYDAALSEQAIGGKVLGAGGGGFFLFFAEPEYHTAIVKKLSPCVHVPFKFEHSGSTIALYNPSGL